MNSSIPLFLGMADRQRIFAPCYTFLGAPQFSLLLFNPSIHSNAFPNQWIPSESDLVESQCMALAIPFMSCHQATVACLIKC